MKKILFVFLFFIFPGVSLAQLDVYLSAQNLPYGKDVWTSANYPDSDSSLLRIERYFSPEEFPSGYQKSPGEIKSLIDGLFPALTQTERQARYNSLVDFAKQDFLQYIAIALSAETQSDIDDKKSSSFVLTPFESVFDNCAIDLLTRRSIARDLITNIHNGAYSDIDTLRYSNIRFGDCIIPFPDARRGSTSISDSFPGNRLIAQSLGGNPLRFGTLEDSVNLFSLVDVVIDGSYSGVQENNLLDLHSNRVEENTTFEKQPGESRVLYIHQNHYKNIYKDVFISGNMRLGYTVGGTGYNASHPLFIRSSDSEVKRTLSGWQELEEGIYSKTLIQEDTFDTVGGTFVPKQNVGITTYYAIIYNYDTTAPECPATLFSHDNMGNENFIFPQYPWFGNLKYGYFICSDEESGCFCDSSSDGCFARDERVLSIPQDIPHSGEFEYRFWNQVGLSSVCSSPVDTELFYDHESPDVHINIPGVAASSLTREYVSNRGVLYDGSQVKGKKFYNIRNTLNFEADDSLDIQLEFYDPYDSSKMDEGVSGLRGYELSILEYENNNWVSKINRESTFEDYNPLGNRISRDSHILNLQDISNIDDIFTQIGQYQLYVNFYDAAGNESRVVMHFDIVAGDVDLGNSTLEVTQRDISYANNSDYYRYSLVLRDEYFNPVVGRAVGSIQHSCLGVLSCQDLRLDMSSTIPSGEKALEIYDVDTQSDRNGVVQFSVRSRSPGVFTESFIVSIGDPLVSLRFSGQDNRFITPMLGTLETMIDGAWVSNNLLTHQISDYRIRIEDTQSLGYAWSLSNFSLYLEGRHPDTDFILSSALDTQVDGVYFSGNFVSSLGEGEEHKTLLEIIQDARSGVIISYTLDAKLVRYRLSADEDSSEILQLTDSRELQNPVKIIGNLQGVGNTHNTSERQNTTDLDTYTFRSIIRKNAAMNIRSRANDTIIGGIKYIDKTPELNKDYNLESNPDFETLVVRNGNILIGDNFNTSGKLVGIVSYIDEGYDKETGFEEIGNIYIEPDVSVLNAFLYADGGLISTQSGNPVVGDVTLRNNFLQHQLTIVGSLFTRNTLAGARQLDGHYMLPGGETTSQQSLASQYDLYYTRRGNDGCIQDAYGFCDIREYLIIEHDPRISINPPELFEMK